MQKYGPVPCPFLMSRCRKNITMHKCVCVCVRTPAPAATGTGGQTRRAVNGRETHVDERQAAALLPTFSPVSIVFSAVDGGGAGCGDSVSFARTLSGRRVCPARGLSASLLPPPPAPSPAAATTLPS